MRSRSGSSRETRRAQPALGTFVEVTAPDGPAAARAVTRAFAAIRRVHALMSAHDERSDLGRLYRARAGAVIEVHSWTWRVLRAARRLHTLTGGAFNPIAAGRFGVATGRLPEWPRGSQAAGAAWADVTLLPGNRVRVARAIRFDLGGIAKGFAVDRAVELLRAAGLAFGLVNAGGDLRAFGRRAWPVHVRRPDAPGELARLGWIRDGAVATSAPYFSLHGRGADATSALFVPEAGRSVAARASATVFAPTCVVADALTKVLLCGGDARALDACGAQGVLITARKGACLAA